MPLALSRGVAAQNSAVDSVRAADMAVSKTACVDKNLDAFVAFWEPTGSVLAANTPLPTGTEAVSALFAPFLSLPGLDCGWEHMHIEVAQSGELAYSRGSYRNRYLDPQGNAIEDRGTYLTIWRKGKDGKWCVVIDTFASEVPLPRN
jgi:ketosteroid isomerase-like protein